MTWPNKEVLLNYTICTFLIRAITATRSVHHNIYALTAVGKTERSWSYLFVRLSVLLHSDRMFSVRLYLLFWLTDWLTDRLTDWLTDRLTDCLNSNLTI
jgi:hypothetical protein